VCLVLGSVTHVNGLWRRGLYYSYVNGRNACGDERGGICNVARFVPVLLTNNGCSLCEGFLIDLLWNRDTNIRLTGEFPVGTNKKGVNSAYGDVNLSHKHPGCLYIHSVHAKFGLEEHDKQLEKT
jgi:hypothetical protein